MATLIDTFRHLLAQKDPGLANETRRIILKEALQIYVLDFLYNHPVYRQLNFYGGTCLHVVYQLNRLSEDLDLDNTAGIPLDHLESDLLTYFQKTILYPAVTAKTQQGEKGIIRVTLKFPVLNELGLSPYPNEALHLKVEVSNHVQIAIIRKLPVFSFGRSFVPACFSLESMMAGKMIACLERNFQRGNTGIQVKGRDFYDLLWFMQRGVQPLEEKLACDGQQAYTVQSAMQLLAQKIDSMPVSALADDLYPMFEQRSYIAAWLENFHANFRILCQNYLEKGTIHA